MPGTSSRAFRYWCGSCRGGDGESEGEVDDAGVASCRAHHRARRHLPANHPQPDPASPPPRPGGAPPPPPPLAAELRAAGPPGGGGGGGPKTEHPPAPPPRGGTAVI